MVNESLHNAFILSFLQIYKGLALHLAGTQPEDGKSNSYFFPSQELSLHLARRNDILFLKFRTAEMPLQPFSVDHFLKAHFSTSSRSVSQLYLRYKELNSSLMTWGILFKNFER